MMMMIMKKKTKKNDRYTALGTDVDRCECQWSWYSVSSCLWSSLSLANDIPKVSEWTTRLSHLSTWTEPLTLLLSLSNSVFHLSFSLSFFCSPLSFSFTYFFFSFTRSPLSLLLLFFSSSHQLFITHSLSSNDHNPPNHLRPYHSASNNWPGRIIYQPSPTPLVYHLRYRHPTTYGQQPTAKNPLRRQDTLTPPRLLSLSFVTAFPSLRLYKRLLSRFSSSLSPPCYTGLENNTRNRTKQDQKDFKDRQGSTCSFSGTGGPWLFSSNNHATNPLLEVSLF